MTLHSISVVIPAYNEENRIAGCLKSVFATKYPDLEVIVVDDHSKDKTVEVASRYAVRLIRRSTRGGISAARNEGIRIARGEIIAFLDADCIVDSDWLTLLASDFTDDKIAGVGGVIRPSRPEVIANYRSFKEREKYTEANGPVEASYLPGGNSSYRAHALQEVGGFDPAFAQPRGHEAFELGRRLRKKGYRLIGEPKVLVSHMSENSLGAWVRTTFNAGYSSLSFLLRHEVREYGIIQLKQFVFIGFLIMLALALVDAIPGIYLLAVVTVLLLFEFVSALFSVLRAAAHFKNLKYLLLFPLEVLLRLSLYGGFIAAIVLRGCKGVIRVGHLIFRNVGTNRIRHH